MRTGTELNILIADYVPSYNRGEAAILYGLLQSLHDAAIPTSKITLCSRRPADDRHWYSDVANVVDVGSRTGKERLLRAVTLVACGVTERLSSRLARYLYRSDLLCSYLRSDVILMGHDNTLAGEATPSVWFVANAWFAKLTGKPIAVIAGSLGPFGHGLPTLVAKNLLNNTDLITLRDPLSYKHCLSLGLRHSRIYLTGDTAFLMQPVSRSEGQAILANLGIACTRPIIGVTASRESTVFQHIFELWGDNRPNTLELREQRHVTELAQALDQVIDEMGVSVLFLPHCTGSGLLDDRRVARMIRDRMRNKDWVWLLEDELSAAELKSVIRELAFFVGERTHSVIAALSCGVPAIAISFPSDHRTYGMLGDLLGLPDHLYDVRHLAADSLAGAIRACWAKRLQTREYLQREIPHIQHAAAQLGFKLRQTLEARGSL